jgi:hypothetical protein
LFSSLSQACLSERIGNKKSAIPKEYGIEGFRTIPKRRFSSTEGRTNPLETSNNKNPVPQRVGFFVFILS